MKLQTNIPFSAEKNTIDYSSKVLLLGSCFTENIGAKLNYYKFQQLQNPFGIIFHSLAIEKLLCRAVNDTKFTTVDVFERDGRWFCFEAHSSVTATTAIALTNLLNEQLHKLSEYILSATHLVLTFGTAWVYRYIALDTIVANCHKLPQRSFLKELLSVAEISASIERSAVLLREINPNAQLICTVSPVRHLKDGFVENGRSKAHLITGIHEAIEGVDSNFYFPSYEIVIDELRDYRFYAEDMLHPTNTAIQYIWEKFKLVWVSSETEQLQKEIASIQKGLQHRPFNTNGAAHQKFQQDLQQKIKKVQEQLPFLNLEWLAPQ